MSRTTPAKFDLLLLDFLAPRTDYVGWLGADESFEAGLANGGQGGGELMAFGGETIAVAFGDFSDEAMSTQDSELAADAGGEFSDVGCGCVEVGGVEQAALKGNQVCKRAPKKPNRGWRA